MRQCTDDAGFVAESRRNAAAFDILLRVNTEASSLSSDLQDLYEQARQASRNAYVPYSSFPVGAAIRTTSGTVYTGCNVENASYGLTICAERVACSAAVAAGDRSFDAIAIHVSGNHGQPCGACRQFLREFGPELTVVYVRDGEPIESSIAALLPDSFEPASLP